MAIVELSKQEDSSVSVRIACMLQGMSSWQNATAKLGNMQQRPASVPAGNPAVGSLSQPGRRQNPSDNIPTPTGAPQPGFRATGSSSQLHDMGSLAHGVGSSAIGSPGLGQFMGYAYGLGRHDNSSSAMTNNLLAAPGQAGVGIGMGACDRPQLNGGLFSSSGRTNARTNAPGSSYTSLGVGAQPGTGLGSDALQLGE